MSEHDVSNLVRLAKEAGIENKEEVKPWLDAALTTPHIDWVVEAASQIIGHHAQKYIKDPFSFRPEYLVPSINPQDDFFQGTCQGYEIYIPLEWRKRSELVVGKPGTGKSTYISQQIQQAIEKNIVIWLFDFKDEHGPLCEKLGIESIKLEELKLNPHELLSIEETVECLSHANLFQNASTGFYRDVLFHVSKIYKNAIFSMTHTRDLAKLMGPNKDLPASLKIDSHRRQTLTARDRVLRSLDDILEPYGDIVDCERGFPIQELANSSIRFNCSSMSYKEATFFIYVLLKSLYSFRNQERIDNGQFDVPLKNLIVIEEAKHVISSIMEEGMLSSVAFIRKITTEVRSSGLGYIFIDQVPSSLAKSAIESCNLITLFRVGLSEDVLSVSGAIGLSDAQSKLIYELPDRFAVTKHGEKKPIRIEIPSS